MKELTIRKNLIKIVVFCITVLGLFIPSSIVVRATEPSDEPVRLDNFTGEAMNESMADNTTIRINPECSYDSSTDQYVINIDNIQVKSSVADGMIINNVVSIETDSLTEISLYKDGM